MDSHYKRRALLLTALVIAALAGLALYQGLQHRSAGEKPVAPAQAENTAAQPRTAARPAVAQSLPEVAEKSIASLISLKANALPEERLAIVHRLLRQLDGLPFEERRRLLREFFRSGADQVTGLPFHIGIGGWLDSWPTLRSALLDHVGRMDPELAAELSTAIFAGSSSSDEWAIALRDEARRSGDDSARRLLLSHLDNYLGRPEWRQDPGTGFLEGFDVVVQARAVELLPRLAELSAASQPRAVQFAAFLGMDRLMLAAPEALLAQLAAAPTLLNDKPELRAGLLARADVRNESQARLLENYLARTDLTAPERAAFAQLYPNHNQAVSNNLLSSQPTRSLSEMASIDAAALARLQTWQASGNYPAWATSFGAMKERLQEGLNQAAAGGIKGVKTTP
jgi:hypothetical protein